VKHYKITHEQTNTEPIAVLELKIWTARQHSTIPSPLQITEISDKSGNRHNSLKFFQVLNLESNR